MNRDTTHLADGPGMKERVNRVLTPSSGRRLWPGLVTVILTLAIFAGTAPSHGEEGIRVRYTSGALTLDPDDPVWDGVRAYPVRLTVLEAAGPVRGTSVPRESMIHLPEETEFIFNLFEGTPEPRVKALHNGRMMAIMVTYEDGTVDTENSPDSFRDSLALLFPLSLSPHASSPLMGAKGEPVNIWQWRADWQAEVQGLRGLDVRQPLTEGVGLSPVDMVLKARYPGRPSSDATAVEYVAEGFGTLTRQTGQDVRAWGRYGDGRWSVVFLREMASDDPSDARFRPGGKTYLNIAVWDGGRGNVDGRKSISLTWIPVTIDPIPRRGE